MPMTPPETLQGRVPPQNLEAESSLLGALLIDRDAIIRISDIIRADDFYKDAHRHIFAAILELFEKHQPIDLLNLSNILQEKKLIDEVGGRTYLTNLTNLVATASHIVSYATIIERKATLRRLLEAAGRMGDLAFKETDDAEALLDEAEHLLFGISQRHLRRTFTPIREVLTEAFDRIDELHKESGKMRGISTGF